MSVSYASQQPFVSSAPVPSIDLNLMAAVLQQKQGLFDANYAKAQSQLSTISSLDMLRDDDKAYRDSKLNELTNNINSLSGDYSDPNISSQIDNSISSVYSDSRILNAISSTKSVRALQAGYQKMQTDPKMMKYFSDANYDADMAEVERYISSKDPADAYRGKSSPTLFSSYMPDLVKAAEKIKPDGWVKLKDGTNQFYNVETKEVVSADKIAGNIIGILDSNQRSQMARDANYLWGKKLNLQPPELITKLTNNITGRITQMEENVKTLENLKGTLGPEDAKLTAARIQAFKTEIGNLKSRKINAEGQYNNYLKNSGSLEGLRFMAYEDDVAKTLGNLYSWSKEKEEKKVEPYEMERIKSINRQNEILLAGRIRKDLMKYEYENKPGDKKANTSPVTFINPSPDKTENGVFERVEFFNSQADVIEDEAVNLYNQNPNIKINKEILTGMGKGRYVGINNLPVNTDEEVIKHNILSFGAQRNRIAAQREEVMYKQYDRMGVNEKDIDDQTLASAKSSLVTSLPNLKLKSTDDFRIVSIQHSDKQFKKNAQTGKLEEDNDFYATIEVKDGNEWTTLKEIVPIPDNIAEAYINTPANIKAGRVIQKQTREQNILNTFVDERNQFSTPVQSKQNPNVVGNISIKKLKDGTFEAFIEYEGVPIPISKLSESKRPLLYAYDAFRLGKGFVESLKSREELKQYVKTYVPDAKMNTKDIVFGNHNIYTKPKSTIVKSNSAEATQPFSVFSDR